MLDCVGQDKEWESERKYGVIIFSPVYLHGSDSSFNCGLRSIMPGCSIVVSVRSCLVVEEVLCRAPARTDRRSGEAIN